MRSERPVERRRSGTADASADGRSSVGIDKFMSECRALTILVGNGVACIVISRSENELDPEKLHQVMAHPIDIGEEMEVRQTA
jgi:hypothetical protein